MSGVTAESGGDVDAFSLMEQIQQTVSDCRQNMRRGASPNAALIFAQRDVAHVENRILDSPVSTDHA